MMKTQTKYRFMCDDCGFISKWIEGYSEFLHSRELHFCKSDDIKDHQAVKQIVFEGIAKGLSRAEIGMALLNRNSGLRT